jgi:hypothetical protein
LEAELLIKDKALNDAQAKLKIQTVKNWHIKQKYKRESCLVSRIQKQLLKLRMGDFWYQTVKQFNYDVKNKLRGSASGLSRMSVG